MSNEAEAPTAPGTDLTVYTPAQRAVILFGSTKREEELKALVAESKELVVCTNQDGRDQIHAARMVLLKTRTGLREFGKTSRDDAVKFSKAIITEENRLVAITEAEELRLGALQATWDDRIEAERKAAEEVERRKIAVTQEQIANINASVVDCAGKASVYVSDTIGDLIAMVIGEEYGVLREEAQAAKDAALTTLRAMYTAVEAQECAAAQVAEQLAAIALQNEADAARRRQEDADRAERQRQEDAEAAERRAEADRIAAAARAEEQRKQDAARAELQAQQDALDREKAERESRAKAEQDERDRIASEEQAERDRVARAEQDERDRVARLEQEERERVAAAAAETERVRKAAADAALKQLQGAAGAMSEALYELLVAVSSEGCLDAEGTPMTDLPAFANGAAALKRAGIHLPETITA